MQHFYFLAESHTIPAQIICLHRYQLIYWVNFHLNISKKMRERFFLNKKHERTMHISAFSKWEFFMFWHEATLCWQILCASSQWSVIYPVSCIFSNRQTLNWVSTLFSALSGTQLVRGSAWRHLCITHYSLQVYPGITYMCVHIRAKNTHVRVTGLKRHFYV